MNARNVPEPDPTTRDRPSSLKWAGRRWRGHAAETPFPQIILYNRPTPCQFVASQEGFLRTVKEGGRSRFRVKSQRANDLQGKAP